MMKQNNLLIIVLMLIAASFPSAKAQTFNYPTKGTKGFSIGNKTKGNIEINYNLGSFSFDPLNYKGEEMAEISLGSICLPNDEGCPNLPVESRFIAIPQGAKATLNVVSFEKEVIRNVNIAPARKIQAENDEPNMDFVKDAKIYATNANYPEKPFVISETTSLRGVDAVVVSISPFQYNPVKKELTVYSNVKLDLQFEGGNGTFGDDRLRSPYWDNILASQLMNYDQLPVIDYSARMQQWRDGKAEGAEYLIITPNNNAWTPFAEQLKDFRTKQGIITEVYRLDEMGVSSVQQLEAWFHNAYNNWEIAPVAVCLMADHNTDMTQGIPAQTASHPDNGTCISDNPYADANGDLLPDMVFSRLVAANANELPVFVGKQIDYETNPCMEENFYHQPVTALGWQTARWFQLCSEVIGGYFRKNGKETIRINTIYQGLPAEQWSTAQNTSNVVNYFGPNGTNYIPERPSELGGWYGGEPEQISAAINSGTFIVQHRDHGFEDGWGEPAFRTAYVDALTNVGKLPFIMSINCLTGKYNHEPRCFAEAFMRHTFNGEPAGAVGVLCPTETSFSYVNDCFVWGAFDLFDPQFMPTYGPYANYSGNWLPAFGSVAGKHFLYQSSWPSIPEYKEVTYQMFTAHCDAFLRLYNEVPQEMTVSYPQVIFSNTNNIAITAPNGCFVSIVKENADGNWDILAVAQSEGNTLQLNIPQQTASSELLLVCTGQNFLRFEEPIRVVPAGGPYIVFDSKALHDSNGNAQLDFGETATFDITVKNIGSTNINAFNAILTSDSPYITITNGTAQFGSTAPNQTSKVDNAFTIKVADNIPDKTKITFTITVENGSDTYTSKFYEKIFSPVFIANGMTITELQGNGNGRLDVGETARLSFDFSNIGHSNSAQAIAILASVDPLVSVTSGQVAFETIQSNENMTAVFDISISNETPHYFICPVTFKVISGNYEAEKTFVLRISLDIEDFESETLDGNWTNDATFPWTFCTDNPYQGSFCMKSGAIPGQRHSDLTLNHIAAANDSITFYYKTSSEEDCDMLTFYIDDTEQAKWSGIKDWKKASFPVSEGEHTYKWSYSKDFVQSSGEDCVWIDFITKPYLGVIASLDEQLAEDHSAIAVYPNPTHGHITIKAEKISRITIANTLGQTIYDTEIQGNEAQINLSQYGTGLYLVRIATVDGISTQLVQVGR